MKIISVDNFNRESYADRLVAENVTETEGKVMVDSLNDKFGGEFSDQFYRIVEDEYRLWRGMEELI